MKSAHRNQIGRAIKKRLPQMRQKGRLIFVTPRGRILRGAYLEDSSDPLQIYVWAFVQPLYVPSVHVVFNLGKRLGGGSRTWGVAESDAIATALRDEAYPFFAKVWSPETLLQWEYATGAPDHYAAQSRAYSLVASGQFEKGAEALHELADRLEGGRPWMVRVAHECRRLAGFAENDPAAAEQLLAEWERETATALGIQDVV